MAQRSQVTYYIVKIAITSVLVVAIAEISKRSSLLGSILASIPLLSVLAMVWLYIDTKDTVQVSNLASGIFWLVLPSLALFLSLPQLLKYGFNFYLSLAISMALTSLCYWLMLIILKRYNIEI